MVLPQLRRVRWAVRATLVLGVAASVAANILHAPDNPISRAIAAWPPLALLLTVELISRVPVHRRSVAITRLAATAAIAGIAAWVSYWHMAGVAARYGETGASPYLLPLSVDGLIVVAGICLVELGGRIATLQTAPAPAPAVAPTGPTAPAAATLVTTPTVAAVPAVATAAPAPAVAAVPAVAAAAAVAAPPVATTGPVPAVAPADAASPGLVPAPAPVGETPAPRPVPATVAPSAAPTRRRPSARTAGSAATTARKGTAPRRTPAETVALAARITADRPGIPDADLAAQLGISVSRWRTIRREATRAADHGLAA